MRRQCRRLWAQCVSASIAATAALFFWGCDTDDLVSAPLVNAPMALTGEVAGAKTVDVSSTSGGFSGPNAVDGLFGPGGTSWSSEYDDNAWIQVDLGGGYRIDYVQLWNRADGCCAERLQNFYIELSLDGLSWTDSGLGLITEVPSDTVPGVFTMTGPIARYVRVAFSAPGYHHVGEMQVFGEATSWPPVPIRPPVGDNLVAPETLAANGGSISVSSTAGGFSPAALTDGNMTTSWSSDTIGQGTVTVDLGELFAIDSVQLSNRGDGCCADRLKNFYIELSTDGTNWTDSGTGLIQVAPSHIVPSLFPIVEYARYVRIRDAAPNWYFHIGELAIYGF